MADPLLNRQLGPYVLRKVVGRGGMGAVYAAEDTQAGGTAAVKVLSPALASDTNFRERFSDEIESLKKLHHPNIVQLLGYGEQDGQLFYAMELIEGASLQEELRQGRDRRLVRRLTARRERGLGCRQCREGIVGIVSKWTKRPL